MDPRVFYAAEHGNTDDIEMLYRQDAELLRQVTFEDNNVLHIAARAGHYDFVEWILHNVQGSRRMCSALNSDGNMPLHEAAQDGDDRLVNTLIPFTKYNIPFTHLHNVFLSNIRFFGLKYHVGILNGFGETPLLIACKYGHENAAKHLIESSSPSSLLLPKYQPCLHIAAYGGHLGVVNLLLDKIKCGSGWEMVLFRSNATGANPLHTSVDGGNIDVVGKILNAPLSSQSRKRLMAAKNGKGMCAIHVAAVKGSYDIIDQFISMGDCVELRSSDRKTVLHFAVAYNQLQVVKRLLANIKPDKVVKLVSQDRDRLGDTTLHLAAKHNVDPQLLRYLLSFPRVEVNVNAVNNEGLTPLDIAVAASAQNSTDAIIQILAQSGAAASTKCAQKFNDNKAATSPSTEQQERESKVVQVDTLVASLVATVTFAAIFQVPGGLEDDKDSIYLGVARLAFQPYFTAFLVADTVALITSLIVVFAWISRERMPKGADGRSIYTFLTALSLGISIVCTVIAFISAVYLVVIPSHVKTLKAKNYGAFHGYQRIYNLVGWASIIPLLIAEISWGCYFARKKLGRHREPMSDRESAAVVVVFVMYIIFIPFLVYGAVVEKHIWGNDNISIF